MKSQSYLRINRLGRTCHHTNRWALSWKSGKSGKVRKVKKGKIVKEKSGNFERLSEPKRSTTPQVQPNDLNFCQNAISRSQGEFS